MNAYGNPVIVDSENKRSILITAGAIAIAFLMVLPVVSYLNSNIKVPSVVYQYGGETVKFSGMNAYVGFGSNLYPVTWKVFQISPEISTNVRGLILTGASSSPIAQETFSTYSYNRILSADQNSAVLLMRNSNMRIAEIFSFSSHGIDASLSFTNLNNTNQSFSVVFSLQQKHDDSSMFGGDKFINLVHGTGIPDSLFAIPDSSSFAQQGNLSLSWQNEMGIYHGGLVYAGTNSLLTDISFGPLTLMRDETYSIDPIISPDQSTPPPNGGGGSGTPPQITDVTVSNFKVTHNDGTPYSEVLGGDYVLDISFDYQVSGAGSANLYFDAVSPIGVSYHAAQGFSVSGSGSYSMQWPIQPGTYSGFAIDPGANTLIYGSSMISMPLYVWSETPYKYPTSQSTSAYAFLHDDDNFGTVWNASNGEKVFTVSQSVGPGQGESGGLNQMFNSGDKVHLGFSAGVSNKTRTLGVWNIDQGFLWDSNTMGLTHINDKEFVTDQKFTDYVQGQVSSIEANSTLMEQAIWNAIDVGLGLASTVSEPPFDIILAVGSAAMTLIGDFLFETENTYSDSIHYSDIWDNLTGVQNPWPDIASWAAITGPGPVMDPVSGQYTILQNQCLSYIFDFNETTILGSTSGYPGNYVTNNFTYVIDVTMMSLDGTNQTMYIPGLGDNPDNSTPAFYSTSISMPVYIVEQ